MDQRLLIDRLPLLADRAVASAFGRELGRAVEYHERIASTQDRARELASWRAVVVADEQTAGRGTQGRSWIAPPGTALLASFVDPGPPPNSPVGSIVAGVAAARALEAAGARDVRLKWPNDVVLAGAKVAGILTHLLSGHEPALVVGVGINVSQRELPAGLRAPATSLALRGVEADRLELLARLSAELDRALVAEPATVLDEWRARSTVLGRRVVVERPGEEPIRGRAHDLSPDGALLVETDYGHARILAGEVRVEEQ
ncbi:MAG TPA: biotin--[acetyl-CoA-carboxylase] ligase [Candidatus Limnocylindria bacterium]|nr:biotin--[acetyl-CoA-carboxylase] ligase [Candidatus Limnocylindria bacterium]